MRLDELSMGVKDLLAEAKDVARIHPIGTGLYSVATLAETSGLVYGISTHNPAAIISGAVSLAATAGATVFGLREREKYKGAYHFINDGGSWKDHMDSRAIRRAAKNYAKINKIMDEYNDTLSKWKERKKNKHRYGDPNMN